MSWSLLAGSVTCGPRAFRPMEFRPTIQGAHTGQCAARMVVLWDNTGRASPSAVEQGLDRTSTTVGQWHGLWKVLSTASYPMARDLRNFASCRTGRPPRSTRRAVRACRGCVVGQRMVRSSPRNRPGFNRTNTATARRHGLWTFMTTTVQLLWRPTRAPCAVWRVSVDRPQSTRRAVRIWRGCVVAQRETRSSPSRQLGPYCTNTAAGWRH